jgi:hypothetical protein
MWAKTRYGEIVPEWFRAVGGQPGSNAFLEPLPLCRSYTCIGSDERKEPTIYVNGWIIVQGPVWDSPQATSRIPQCAPHIPKALTDYQTNEFWRIEALSNPDCGRPSKPAIPSTLGQLGKVDLLYKGGCHPGIDMDPTHLSSPASRVAIGQANYTQDAGSRPPICDRSVLREGNSAPL